MQLIKSFLLIVLVAICTQALTGCQRQSAANQLRVGTIAGPGTELMQVAKQVAAKKYGLNIKIVQFTDYIMPNQALAGGEIDANVFQHLPYLKIAIKAKHYKIVSIGKTFITPMGIYSKKIHSLAQLKSGDSVAIPNDPSNEARALLLLQKARLIKLRKGAGITATTEAIVSNPLKLKFKTLNAAELPRVLSDVTIAAINTNYAMMAGLVPTKNSLFIESPHSPYANIIAVRADEVNNPKYKTKLKQLVSALHSPEVLQAAKKLFKGQAIPAWNADEAAVKNKYLTEIKKKLK